MYILWGDLLSLNENVIFWRFSLFSIFSTFSFDAKMANFKAQIVDWYLDFTKESYATLKSVIFFSKSVFKTIGN